MTNHGAANNDKIGIIATQECQCMSSVNILDNID